MYASSNPRRLRLLALVALASLAGCGGGGTDAITADPAAAPAPVPAPAPAPAPVPGSGTAEGVYGGSLTGSTSPGLRLLVLPDGEFWAIYGRPAGAAFEVAGFIQGTGSSSNGSFTSADSRDFGSFPALAGSVAATFDAAAKTITGSFGSVLPSVAFSGAPITGSLYNFSAAASLGAIAGTWVGANNFGETVTLNIAADGAMTGSSSGGCVFSTGKATPSTTGRNVFALKVTQGPSCSLPGQTLTGMLVSYPLAAGRTELLGAMKDASRTAGVAFYGTR